MHHPRRNLLVYALLFAFWTIVIVWQITEHRRVKQVAQTGLESRAREVADTLGAFIRGLQYRAVVLSDRLEPVLKELVNDRTNRLTRSTEIVWIALLNAANEPLAAAGKPTIELNRDTVLPVSGLWSQRAVTMEFAVAGVPVTHEGTNAAPTVVVPPFRDLTNNPPPDGFRGGRGRREGRSDSDSDDQRSGDKERTETRRDQEGPRERPPRRPFWARGLNEAEYQAAIQRRELHGLIIAISTDSYLELIHYDRVMRAIIVFFSGISVLGAALTWRNLFKSSELQVRLVRASEMNTHLKEMNLAAAGLAHETRNPLNIIRGMAQMISKQQDVSTDTRERSRAIIDETDKVTAQLNEFINYSRPREVRRTPVALQSVQQEVARALNYDIEEKSIRLEVKGEPLTIEADEQMLRQVLFNLVLNAVQALGNGGQIEISSQRQGGSEASLEVRDNGPGVPPERRSEIFKPYFTTHQKGTGLGLAIVQQIVLAHGWEIECLANEPQGAVFRIRHLRLVS
ncbi:MAG TPA: ATP-binding protein [Verrucomicrobiae bacterium]|nr:ATP-binding protein [Verrucomicrobiae bacterium]